MEWPETSNPYIESMRRLKVIGERCSAAVAKRVILTGVSSKGSENCFQYCVRNFQNLWKIEIVRSAVNQILKSPVREIRTPDSVGVWATSWLALLPGG